MEDMLAPAAADQALDFWHTIVEPFFGLPPQKREPKDKVIWAHIWLDLMIP